MLSGGEGVKSVGIMWGDVPSATPMPKAKGMATVMTEKKTQISIAVLLDGLPGCGEVMVVEVTGVKSNVVESINQTVGCARQCYYSAVCSDPQKKQHPCVEPMQQFSNITLVSQ